MERNKYPSLFKRQVQSQTVKRVKVRKEPQIPTASLYDDLGNTTNDIKLVSDPISSNCITIFGFSNNETLESIKSAIKIEILGDLAQNENNSDVFNKENHSGMRILDGGTNWVNIEMQKEDDYNKIISLVNGKIFNTEMVGALRRYEGPKKKEDVFIGKPGIISRFLIYIFGGEKSSRNKI